MRSKARSALRKVWRATSRSRHLQEVRFPYKGKSGRGKWGVKCVYCGKVRGLSEKFFPPLKNGKVSKRKTLAYQVDHIHDNAPLLDLKDDLGKYAETLFYGELRVLCYDCHKDRTKKQRGKK
jgi:hypothetical protein